jgi:CBS domain-containing protein
MGVPVAEVCPVKIAQILSSKGDFVATVEPSAPVSALLGLLAEHGVGAMVVSRDGRQIDGIVSERDVVRALADRGDSLLGTPVQEIMTAEVRCAPPDTHVDDLMGVMTDHRVRHVPVVDEDGLLVGIVSIGDVVKTRLSELEGERAALLDYVTRGG